MNLAQRDSIGYCGATCEYWLAQAALCAELGCPEAQQDAIKWAELVALSAFRIVGRAP